MKTLQSILNDIASKLNLATTEQQAIEMGLTHYLELDYNSYYGGYRLINVSVESGGHCGAFGESSACNRSSKKVFEAYLSGIYNGIIAAKNN